MPANHSQTMPALEGFWLKASRHITQGFIVWGQCAVIVLFQNHCLGSTCWRRSKNHFGNNTCILEIADHVDTCKRWQVTHACFVKIDHVDACKLFCCQNPQGGSLRSGQKMKLAWPIWFNSKSMHRGTMHGKKRWGWDLPLHEFPWMVWMNSLDCAADRYAAPLWQCSSYF